MKTKIVMTVTLAAVLGGSAMWFASHPAIAAETAPARQQILHYTCPMHPSVKADKPGDCPVCGMHLVPVFETDDGTNASAMMPGCCSPGMHR